MDVCNGKKVVVVRVLTCVVPAVVCVWKMSSVFCVRNGITGNSTQTRMCCGFIASVIADALKFPLQINNKRNEVGQGGR